MQDREGEFLSSVLAFLNAIPVPVAFLSATLRLYMRMAPDQREPPEDHLAYLLGMLRSGNHCAGEEQDVALAIDFRIHALTRLLARGEVPGWPSQDDPAARDRMNACLSWAAATEPLIADEKRMIVFGIESFTSRVLDLIRPDEHA